MQSQLKRLISAVLVLTMIFAWYIPGAVSAEDNTTSELLFKEDFGLGTSYSVGTSWSGATIPGMFTSQSAIVKTVLDGNNTVLDVNLTSETGNLDARFDSTGAAFSDSTTFMDASYLQKTIIYQFKFKPMQTPSFTVNLRARYDNDGDGAVDTTWLQAVFVVNSSKNEVKAFGTKIDRTFEAGTWYDIALVCNFADGSAGIYIDGTKVGGNFTIPSYTTLSGSSTKYLIPLLRFLDIAIDGDNNEYYLDDIAVYTGSVLVDQFADDKKELFSENFAGTDYSVTTDKPGSGILLVQDLTDYVGKVTYTEETDGNHALNVTTSAASDAWQINAKYTPTGEWGSDNTEAALGDVCGKTIFYQFMLKINSDANFIVMQRTYNNSTKGIYPVRVVNNVLKAGDNKTDVATLDSGKWYSIVVALVYPENGTGTIENHVYLNGEYKGNYSCSVGENNLSNANYMVRFSNATGTNASNFLLDNIAVYEASGIDSTIFGGNFTSNSVTLNAKLGVNFYTTAAGTVKVSNTNGSTEPVVATSANAVDEDGDWKHTVRVLPQYMMNDMTAGLYGEDGELIATDTFNLSTFTEELSTAYPAWADLAAKTLQYCTAAAIEEGKYTDSSFSVSTVSPDLSAYADKRTGGVTTNLILDDACDLKIWIPANLADSTLTVDGTEIGTVSSVCTLDDDGTYGYTVATELLPQSYDNQYTVKVGDHPSTVSVLGWMQRYIPDNTEATAMNQLVWALYEYYVAAEAMAS